MFLETLTPIAVDSAEQVATLTSDLKKWYVNRRGIFPYSRISREHYFFLYGHQIPELFANFVGYSYLGIGKIIQNGEPYVVYEQTYSYGTYDNMSHTASIIILRYNRIGCIEKAFGTPIKKRKDIDKAINNSISFATSGK